MSVGATILTVFAIWAVAATVICVSAVVVGARMERMSQQSTGEEGP